MPHTSQYGVCEHTSFTTNHVRSAQLYAVMRAAGIGMTRTDFHWTGLQRGNAAAPFQFENFDRVVQTAKAANMPLLPIVTSAPRFAEPLYEHADQWRQYVRAVVSRYAGEMRCWEIWNEHNFAKPQYWGAKDRHEANYTETLRIAFETIKQIDPALVVVYGGTAHVPLDYIEKTLQSGAGEYFDVMNIHPYGTSTLPEAYLFEQLRGLKTLMAKYGQEKKPIWATEIGWPTVVAQKPWIYKSILPRAFRETGIDPAQTSLGVIADTENGFMVQSPAFDLVGNMPAFKNVRKVRLAELAALDVHACPVLVPCREETFPRAFLGDLVDYVRRGGTVLLPEGIPFGYDKTTAARGVADPAPHLRNSQKSLHIQVSGCWSMGIEETGDISIPGITPPETKLRNARFLDERNLEPGDRFIPLVFGVNGEKRYPFAGVYKLNSSLKGNVIVVAARGCGVREEASRELQACVLPRAILIMLAEGVEKVFWYKLSCSGVDASGDREQNFGIVDNRLVPKPAFNSYATLIRERPDGSTRPAITQRDGVYRAVWTRPDGAHVQAVWTAEEETPVSLELSGNLVRAVDFVGKPVEVKKDGGKIAVVASPRIVYLTAD